jgi:L-ribulose-5-phosphate 3-epimerase
MYATLEHPTWQEAAMCAPPGEQQTNTMTQHNRRHFLQVSTAAMAAPFVPARLGGDTQGDSRGEGAATGSGPSPKPLRLGLIIGVGKEPEAAISKVRDLGLPTAQILLDDFEPEMLTRLRKALDSYGVEATSLVVGGPGPEVYDFYQGPLTCGLVPRQYRAARLERLKRASEFAKQCGIPAVQTHCGFIPENPNDILYKEVVLAIREAASACKSHGQNFRCETGQETPITLIRAIMDVGLENVGVNFDLANLILYGKGNPTDAIELFGPYVQGIHAKDGLFPRDPKELGKEVPIGQGKVDFPRIVQRLKESNYQGAVTIEREISGPQQVEDVRAAKVFLEKLIG